MAAESPLVSVVMPAYNAQEFLAEAIESVERQAYEPLEVILVDDGSTDNTARVVSAFGERVHYFLQAHRGVAAARNMGLRLAKGELIAFLDADDLWPEQALRLELEILAKAQEVDAVMGLVQYVRISIDSSGQGIWQEIAEPTLSCNLGTALFRRCVFERVGHFDETLEQSEDLDWFMRLREHGVTIQVMNRVTLLYRIHTQNISRDRSVRLKLMMRALKQSLDRRRGKGEAASSLPRLVNPRLSKDNPGEEGKNG
jgi:glycosyltransferase involved in cell wall biosynthesis